jgi:hypothetical protein
MSIVKDKLLTNFLKSNNLSPHFNKHFFYPTKTHDIMIVISKIENKYENMRPKQDI